MTTYYLVGVHAPRAGDFRDFFHLYLRQRTNTSCIKDEKGSKRFESQYYFSICFKASVSETTDSLLFPFWKEVAMQWSKWSFVIIRPIFANAARTELICSRISGQSLSFSIISLIPFSCPIILLNLFIFSSFLK